MEPQFTQDGVSYRATLPIGWRSLAGEPTQEEVQVWMYGNVTLLHALATIETHPSEKETEVSAATAKILERLESKVDLALNLVARLLAQSTVLPATCPAILTAETLEWRSVEAPAQHAFLVISAYLSPKLPLPLMLPARVEALGTEPGGSRVFARFTHLDEDTLEWLSRTIFRYHRRAIHTQHQV
jgi:hypothetical protein